MQIDEHGTITASKYSNKTLKNNKWGHYEIHLFTQMYMWNLQTADYIHSVVEVVEDFRLYNIPSLLNQSSKHCSEVQYIVVASSHPEMVSSQQTPKTH